MTERTWDLAGGDGAGREVDRPLELVRVELDEEEMLGDGLGLAAMQVLGRFGDEAEPLPIMHSDKAVFQYQKLSNIVSNNANIRASSQGKCLNLRYKRDMALFYVMTSSN